MGWLLSIFTGGFGTIILKMLPYLIAIGIVVGAFFYGHHVGTVACHEKELQAVIDAQNAKMEELQKQYAEAQAKITDLNKRNAQISDITKSVVQKIGQMPNPKNCGIGKDVIDLINQARSGTTGAPQK